MSQDKIKLIIQVRFYSILIEINIDNMSFLYLLIEFGFEVIKLTKNHRRWKQNCHQVFPEVFYTNV